jgi:hypothetical protein
MGKKAVEKEKGVPYAELLKLVERQDVLNERHEEHEQVLLKQLRTREDEVINLQERCVTQVDTIKQLSEQLNTVGTMLRGAHERITQLGHETQFSLLRPRCLEAVQRATGVWLVICPKCGLVWPTNKDQNRGVRICADCQTKAEWHWHYETRWTRDKMGNFIEMGTEYTQGA